MGTLELLLFNNISKSREVIVYNGFGIGHSNLGSNHNCRQSFFTTYECFEQCSATLPGNVSNRYERLLR